ncbi:GntR family transcriptional regulator of vanillate catabolism [Novosphingobium sp. SG707]|nr:GntR family transcriptional regulator of vanillate catabolism [Novosphingobium sp. SG707]
MIVSGELQPGDRLQAQMLADRLGVSRTPVNDALAVLHKEGLLDYGVNRGYGVRRFDLCTLLDAFDVRLTLEGLACRLIAERGVRAETVAQLRSNLGRSEDLLFAPNWSSEKHARWRQLNLEFHDLLLEEANNSYLTSGVASARSLPPILDRTHGSDATDEIWPLLELKFSQDAWRDHVRIVEAIELGQGSRAENMMKEHVFSSREKARRIIQQLLPSG